MGKRAHSGDIDYHELAFETTRNSGAQLANLVSWAQGLGLGGGGRLEVVALTKGRLAPRESLEKNSRALCQPPSSRCPCCACQVNMAATIASQAGRKEICNADLFKVPPSVLLRYLLSPIPVCKCTGEPPAELWPWLLHCCSRAS